MQLLRDVDLYKSSKLPPRAGGLLDQDAIFVDALEVYETGLDDYRTWQAKQQA